MYDSGNISRKKIMGNLGVYLQQTVCKLFNCPKSILIKLENTKKDFEGDVTLVVFPFIQYSKISVEKTA